VSSSAWTFTDAPVLVEREQVVDHVEPPGPVRIVHGGQVDQLDEAQRRVVPQLGQDLADALGGRLERQFAEGDLERRRRAGGIGDDPLAELGQRFVGDGVAHRSIVPVRRIFFCSCSTP